MRRVDWDMEGGCHAGDSESIQELPLKVAIS